MVYYDSNRTKHVETNQALLKFKRFSDEDSSKYKVLYEDIHTAEGEYVRSRVKPRFFQVDIGTSGLTAIYTDYMRREGPIIARPNSGIKSVRINSEHK